MEQSQNRWHIDCSDDDNYLTKKCKLSLTNNSKISDLRNHLLKYY